MCSPTVLLRNVGLIERYAGSALVACRRLQALSAFSDLEVGKGR